MLYDFLQINKHSTVPIYIQIYNSFKIAVENGSISKGSKLPSIRKLCDSLSVSKTTVEAAYNQLCAEGYIISYPQKGYFIDADIKINKNLLHTSNISDENTPQVFKYDFGSKKVENNKFNIKLWRTYMKEILNKDYLISEYGNPQGEKSFRIALQKYSFGTRGVLCGDENIIVGAGTQPLLYIFCGLMGINKKAAIEKGTYIQAEQVFSDFGYDIHYYKNDSKGINIESLSEIKPDILLINPNFNTLSGENTPIERRINLIKKASELGCVIIEDDYNGELRYNTNPIPCIQSYDNSNVIYIGSFSKTLLPSVRISYMVLTAKLLKEYKKVFTNYNQTASKIEQLALTQYINQGKFENHLRKTRKHYSQKSKIMIASIKKHFGKNTIIQLNETSLYVAIKIKTEFSKDRIFDICKTNDINIIKSHDSRFTFNLSFSGIETDRIDDGIKKISELIL